MYVQGLLLDADYLWKRDPPCMRLFVKTDGEVVSILDENYQHYFYALSDNPSELARSIRRLKVERKRKTIEPVSAKVVGRKLKGELVKTVEVKVENPGQITPLKEKIQELPSNVEVFEHDIPPARRYMIDHELAPAEGVKANVEHEERNGEKEFIATNPPEPEGGANEEFRLMSFDIEVYSSKGSPNSEQDPIIMLSMADNEDFRKVLTWKDFESDLEPVEVLNGERELLERFVEIVKDEDFDMITGYNTDLFDFPYLRDRAEELGVDLTIGRGNTETTSQNRRFGTVTKVPGRPHLDVYTMVDFLSTIGTLRLIHYTLENVYEHMFDETKADLEEAEIAEAWEEGGEKGRKLLEYSLSDSEAALELCQEVLPLMTELSGKVKQSLFDVSRMTSGQLVEWLLIYRAHQGKGLVPTKPDDDEYKKRRGKSFSGGYVMEPEKGLHEDLVVFDFRSLYPTIIASHNISPGTLNCDCCSSDTAESPPNLDHQFCQKENGFIPEILEELVMDRAELKKELSNVEENTAEHRSLYNRQWALKIIANSFYGMLGYAKARWYCGECAQSVTSYGRHYIRKTMERAENEDLEVVYGDTDSLLCKVGEKDRSEIEQFLRNVNEKMPGIMELELEGFFKRGVFITKKRYAMVSEDGKMEVKGLEYVRRDWAGLAKKTQEQVLEAILQEGSPEKAAQIVRDVTKKVKRGKAERDDLVIHKNLKKPIGDYKTEGPHVKAARRLRKTGGEIEPGMTISYIVKKGSGNIGDRSIPESEFGDKNYDPEYYIGHQILPAVMRVMEVLRYSEEDLRYEETKQTQLGKFGN